MVVTPATPPMNRYPNTRAARKALSGKPSHKKKKHLVAHIKNERGKVYIHQIIYKTKH